jgi:hypothetical protein
VAPNIAAFLGNGKCAQLVQADEQYGQALATAATGGSSADIQKEEQVFQQFADNAPSDIKSDFEVIASAFKKYADALQGVNLSAGQTPSASQLAKLAALGHEINQQQLQQAGQNISAWVAKNCTGH